MERHVRSVALLNISVGALGLVFAILYLYFSGGFTGILGIQPQQESFNYRSLPLSSLGEIAMVLFFLCVSPLLAIAGVGLLWWQEWARLLAIALSAVNMLNLPVGTALGVYSLWTLLSPEVEPLFSERPGRMA